MDPTPESSCISSEAPPPPPPPSTAASQLLEISLISAQDLAPVSKSMHTYGVVWIRPNKKHTTRTDNHGQRNPKWNDKCVFSLDNPPENNDATVTVEIYTVSWFRDVIVGMVRVRVADLITPLTRTRNKNTRFVALQIRRPSGSPQGILNMGVALSDTAAMRSMPLSSKNRFDEHKQNDDVTDLNIVLWRSLSAGDGKADDLSFPDKPGSICNGSTVDNGSDLCSDVGPSASVVAAEINTTAADQETGSSILEELTAEEAKAKGYKSVATSKEMWRRAMVEGGGDESELLRNGGGRRRSRRSSDEGRFSCFGNAYGIEFTIVCGAGKNPSSNNKRSGCRRRTKKTISSKANSA
ncbi:hypothetical protein ABFS82_06G173800 [Erythranthe guttata]|uniref:C2 domain-containing protein n=1 Tax=Erythranthe guttata TaxID=4155 RepID=A0A022RJ41_ERYGU|nr:PREDICTED: uncharacterized protein LOC105955360 [Erythranthe guttata]EYU39778.1 hypothetical protein MIMGU_mgv1a009123mg [Erythranthe guttata]|eukprot:XP_012834530.1 PREDICTED: uncharacterized protein LOC105955360 [Erythranthe guttata]